MIIFPLIANISTGTETLVDSSGNPLSSVDLKVDIPCPGHAPLIMNEIESIEGVGKSSFSFPNYFEVNFDKTKTSVEKILELSIFKEYPPTVLETKTTFSEEENTKNNIFNEL